MKKITLFFVVMALAMFTFVFAAFAQDAVLSAIDEIVAEAYLGTWYMDKMCFDGSCLNTADMGVTTTLTFNTDNTYIMESEGSEEEPDVSSWYMEDGTAYISSYDEESNPIYIAAGIDKYGDLVIAEEGTELHFVRELTPTLGFAPVKENAALEDFAGEWFLNGISDEEMGYISASFIGMSGTLTVNDSTLTMISSEEEPEEFAYEFEDGKIYFIETSTDEDGNDYTCTSTLEYHEDNTITYSSVYDDPEIQAYMGTTTFIFVREEDLTEGPSFFDMLTEVGDEVESTIAEAEEQIMEMSEEKLAEAEAQLETLLQQIEEDPKSQELIDGINQFFADPEVQGFISGFQEEDGSFSKDSVLNGLGELLKDEKTGEKPDLSGLLDSLSGLFKDEEEKPAK